MVRPRFNRHVAGEPFHCIFKPAGVPARNIAEVVLTLDEFEAVRLADYNGLYQEQAAGEMNISRQTFGRIIESAHKKIAQALVQGLALRIQGGDVDMKGMRTFKCSGCHHTWNEPFGTGRPKECPSCRTDEVRRIDSGPRHRQGQCGRDGQVKNEHEESRE